MKRSARTLWLSAAACWLIAVAYFLHRYPLTLPAPSEPEKPAVFELRDNGAPVALLIDTATIADSWRDNNPETADYSLGWVNILEQECGRFDILTGDELTDSALAQRRLIILSRSIQHKLNDTQSEALREFMNAGEAVVIEFPTQELCDRLGLDVRVTNPADDSDELKNTNTFQNYTLPGSISAPSDPVGEAFRVGRGVVLLTAANLSWFVTTLQQGLPERDFVVTNRNGRTDEGAKLESNDLAPPDSLIDTDSPVADIIERATFNRLAELAPFPRWHTAPDTFAGVFLMTHDEEGLGDPGLWMNRYEAANGFSSTTFYLPARTHTRAGADSLRALGGEAGLHWNRLDRADKGAYDTLRIWRWGPLKQKRSLADQLAWFAEVTGQATRYNRNHYFLWDDSYARTFRILNAHGITMDLSYGPDLEQKGYLFATAIPFHPLDNNGAAFSLRETPVTWAEHFGGADSAWIERILTDNAEIHHGVISALYHNNTFDWRPDYDTYTSWRRSYQLAERTNHALFRVSELESFLQARCDSPLDWTLTAGALEVSGNARDDRLALIIPRTGLGRPETAAPVDLITNIDQLYWRVDVPRGPFTLRVPRLEESIQQK